MKKFKVGDVVRLASGGPNMTIIGDGVAPGHVECQWFDKHGQSQQGSFPEDALIPPTPFRL